MQVAPYPYERWPKWSRGGAAVASSLARIALHAEGGGAARIIDAAASALGADTHLAAGPAAVWSARELGAQLIEPLAALVVLVRLDGRDYHAVLELTAELAAALVDRVLGGDGAAARVPGAPLDELELGALGYLAARAAAATGGRMRVRALTAERRAVLEALAGEERVIVWPLQLNVAGGDGPLRVLLPERAAPAWLAGMPDARRFDVPSALLGLPLRLCAHATTVRLSAAELSSLQPGDIVVPERSALAGDGNGGFHGHGVLHVLGQRAAARARCSLSDRALRIEAFEQGEHAMNDDNPEALLKDAPIELCVELARFTVRLEDVLGLRIGEVWSTGCAIGERVTLTANGRAIARGELVDIEGEVGVRILEKTG